MNGPEDAAGEFWDEGGPIVLSLVDIGRVRHRRGASTSSSTRSPTSSTRSTASLNGRPPLHAGMDPGAWARAFTDAFKALCEAPDDFALDPYAAEAPEEFLFAVASEYFFEVPETLADEHPAVYAQLAAFYRQDPCAAAG